MLTNKGLQRRRTDFLLTLKNEFDVMAHQAILDQILKGFHLYHRLTLIIVRTTSIKPPVANIRFPRITLPRLQRLHRHHIVMSIYENGYW